MKRFTFYSTVLLSVLLLVSSTVEAQQNMTPELLWQVKRMSVEGLSADKSSVLYSLRSYNVATEKSTTEHYAVQIKSGLNMLTYNNQKSIIQRSSSIWYAQEGDKIFYSKDASKTWNYYASVPADAENIKVSPDGNYLAYSREVQVQKLLGKDKYPELQKTSAHIYTDLNYRHWDTWEDGKYAHLFIQKVGTNSAKDLLLNEPFDVPQKPFGGAEDFTFSPDSKVLVYVCKKKTGKEYAQSTNTDLYAYDITNEKTSNLTQGMMGYDQNPIFSPDGKYLAFTSMARDGFEADKVDIILIPWQYGLAQKRINLTARWDESAGGIAWANDSRTVYTNAAYRGTEQLFAASLPLQMDGVKAVPSVRQITSGNFNITGVVAEVDKQIIVTRTDFNHATEIFSVDKQTGKMRQLSNANDAFYSKINMGKSEMRMVKTNDGKEMGVWVIYPPGFTPTKKYPTLLYCQGGPQSALSQFYSFRWNFQLMAAQGYIVVAPNRRGMPGWGTEWNEAISKDWGGKPMQDYLAAIDAISKEPYVDKNRLGCVGASYGGYSVFMLAGMHQNRFKTFIAHDGLFDMKSWYGTTEELWFANWDLGGNYWTKPTPTTYDKFDPSKFVDKWTAPIMIIQGGKDFRVGIEQGLEAFQAAQLRGLKSKLLYFPDENHWVTNPQNAIVWQREFYSWLDETL